jgi:hypothetical protein
MLNIMIGSPMSNLFSSIRKSPRCLLAQLKSKKLLTSARWLSFSSVPSVELTKMKNQYWRSLTSRTPNQSPQVAMVFIATERILRIWSTRRIYSVRRPSMSHANMATSTLWRSWSHKDATLLLSHPPIRAIKSLIYKWLRGGVTWT